MPVAAITTAFASASVASLFTPRSTKLQRSHALLTALPTPTSLSTRHASRASLQISRRAILLAPLIALLPSRAAAASSPLAPPPPPLRSATFAGGCFWCMEAPFDNTPGVVATTSGYTGGRERSPTYDQVSSRKTHHLEAVRIDYDPSLVDYNTLLAVFYRNVDPTRTDGQFCDTGPQYRPAIFFSDEAERKAADDAAQAAAASHVFGDKAIVVEIAKAGDFWMAEDYHQNFYRTNSALYKFYRANCGRDRFLDAVWGKSSEGFSAKDVPQAIRERLELAKTKNRS